MADMKQQAKAKEDPRAEPALSSSVEGVSRRLTGPVTASAFVVALCELHPEYMDGRARKLALVESPSSRRLGTGDWLRQVRALFDKERTPRLHGRNVAFGLALLEPSLRDAMETQGLLSALVAELDAPPEELLSPRGTSLWRRPPSKPAPSKEPSTEPPEPTPEPALPVTLDSVPTHTDNPARVDNLDRQGFARVLAARIRDMRKEETDAATVAGDKEFPRGRAFLVHVHAEWGAGKTSLLNFLGNDLRGGVREEPWVVIPFNAWQHQRIAPPWWWLMTTVYHEGFHELWKISKWRALGFRWREWLWRARGGWPGYLMVIAGVALAAASWRLGYFHRSSGLFSWRAVPASLAAAAAVASSVLTVVGALRGANRWLLSSSARGARAFIDHARDPMQDTKEHFHDLVAWLHYPVAIFVDDLDRCKAPYVVELLEGIQTLFRDVPVAYVVAADRSWLSDSYTNEYGSFVMATSEPGRPLGDLFLEKTFQLSQPLPPIERVKLDQFWSGLIRKAVPLTLAEQSDLEQKRRDANDAFGGLRTEDDVHRELARDVGSDPLLHRARVEAAAIRLATPAVAQTSRHILEPFAELLEPNPRAMKRLVNAYGMARGIETLNESQVKVERRAQETTALWAVLNLRWPRLAEYLATHPDAAARIAGGKGTDGAPDEIAPLFADVAVRAVIQGKPKAISAKLTPAAIRSITGAA